MVQLEFAYIIVESIKSIVSDVVAFLSVNETLMIVQKNGQHEDISVMG